MEDTKAGSSGQATEDKQQSSSNEFIASTSFTGSRDGYVFTTGAHGTGYYKDTPLHLRKLTSKPKPAMLKSSSIVKGLRKPNALPDAKKRKTDSDAGSKPAYLKEMDKYHAMNCSSNTQHDRPLVK